MTINIDELTLGQIKQLTSVTKTSHNPFWIIGKKYFIRTITMHLTGELIYIDDKEIVLRDAAWIADSGRFHDALKAGGLSEIEPFIEDVVVGRGAIVDATIWIHKLPREQK